MTTFPASPMTALIDAHVRYDLAESTSPPLTVGDLASGEELAGLTLGYGTSRGDPELRELIAAATGVRADQVLVTAGAIDAMFLVAQATVEPGEQAVLVSPCFPPARTVPEALGATIDVARASFDDGYRLPVAAIAGLLSARTKLVSLASPQNPSGVLLRAAELRDMLSAVRERSPQAVVLVDETYRFSGYAESPVPPSAAALSPHVVTCGSVSKAHGAPGLRVGWLTVTDPDLYERLREAKFQSAIAGANVDEFLAARVLARQSAILASRGAYLAEQLATLRKWSADHGVEMVVPDAGALCCLRVPAGVDVDGFYARLADLEVRVGRGSWFGESDRVFRVGFGHLPADEFRAALERLGTALIGGNPSTGQAGTR
ncbi:pyridoxal phosphate-dependent aminotransferase [Actinoplanes rectilineatus]|uniref:pyridoxal phosphate-dependent aminotransferase n=1 Tax=Actinoplanes rectilineatus TaxID=113571 RepID=UPI000B2F3466|nr:pyridoxal phosphate-dependent aminotransferase [Actinoplanes rectilineatus]